MNAEALANRCTCGHTFAECYSHLQHDKFMAARVTPPRPTPADRREAAAYYTDDARDAVYTAVSMAATARR